MWWNFIGRSHDEIVEFRRAWNQGPGTPDDAVDQRPATADGGQFGVVHGFSGDRLPAPPMPGTRLKSRAALALSGPARLIWATPERVGNLSRRSCPRRLRRLSSVGRASHS